MEDGVRCEQPSDSDDEVTLAKLIAKDSRKRKAKRPVPSSSSSDEEFARKNKAQKFTNPAKIVAGEVVRQWQTKSRNKGIMNVY